MSPTSSSEPKTVLSGFQEEFDNGGAGTPGLTATGTDLGSGLPGTCSGKVNLDSP